MSSLSRGPNHNNWKTNRKVCNVPLFWTPAKLNSSFQGYLNSPRLSMMLYAPAIADALWGPTPSPDEVCSPND